MARLTRINFDTAENPETITVAMDARDAQRVTQFLGAQCYGTQAHPHMISALNDLTATVARTAASPDVEITIALTASQATWTAMFLGSPPRYLDGQPPYAQVIAHVDPDTREACDSLYDTLMCALNPFAENDYQEFAR